MAKITTFNGQRFWAESYAHSRAKLLRLVEVPDESIRELVNVPYLRLPGYLRYKIETSSIKRSDLV